ncbi:MAG: inositol monophosphatase family protein [Candidatus Brennerbacteria bacterium]|nr:inositol monophosphatase family protein [Candidatus Brennerbacteria bacterium]
MIPGERPYIPGFHYNETKFQHTCFKFTQFFKEKIMPVFFQNQPVEFFEKEGGDLVSETDKIIESKLMEFLPKILPVPILSEEKETAWPPPMGNFWLIDPLDGTHNYLAGIDAFGVSIVLVENYMPTFTAVFLPSEEKCSGRGIYFAGIQRGAHRKTETGTQSIHVSQKKKISEAFLLIEGQKNTLSEKALRLIEKTWRFRNGISSSWSGTRIAAGEIFPNGADILISIESKPWDTLPNALLAEEAGGRVTDFNGQEITLSNCANLIFTNENLHQTALDIINNHQNQK